MNAIASNVACTTAVREFIELGESLCSDGGHDVRRFWAAVACMASERAGLIKDDWKPPKNELAPLSDQASRVFGQTRMPFGKHSGTRVDDVDLGYLEFLADCDSTKFTLNLIRYVRSRRIRDESRRQAEFDD